MCKTFIMSHIHLFVAFCATLLPNFQSLTYEDVNFLDRQVYFENSANDLFTNRLNGTRFCESILLPSQQTYIKAIHAAFTDKYFTGNGEENDLIDFCCRSIHECEAYKGNEFDHTNIRHCNCINLFRKCLKSTNSTKSDELAFIYSINATKCYAKTFPVIGCAEFEAFSNLDRQFDNQINVAERNKFFNRCIRSTFDRKRPQILQLFDLPLGDYGMAAVTATPEEQKPCDNVAPCFCKKRETTTNATLPSSQLRAGKRLSSVAELNVMAVMTSMTVMFDQVEDIHLLANGLSLWEMTVVPTISPYNKGVFRIQVQFPDEFPYDPPTICFKTQIYHPNIDENGNVCLSTTSAKNWTPSTKIKQVIGDMLELIDNPQLEQALRPDLADQYKNDRDTFVEMAGEFMVANDTECN